LDRELTDTSGLPAPKLHHRLSGNSQRNLTFALERMREAHEAAGARYVVDEPNIASGHLLGTARMGTDARTSVVDQFCRSHDIPNLLIVDGSVMVTSGAMNPTATITALALRPQSISRTLFSISAASFDQLNETVDCVAAQVNPPDRAIHNQL